MARTTGIFVASNTVTAIPDGGNVELQIFDSTKNPATDTPDAVWPLSVAGGQFVIDIADTITVNYPDSVKLAIVATTPAGAVARKLIQGAQGSIVLERLSSNTGTGQDYGVHPLTGYNIVAGYMDYQPPTINYPNAQLFTSVSALQAQLNSTYDHGGAIYALTGTHSITTDLRINASNCKVTTNRLTPALLDGGGDRTGVAGSNFGIFLNNCQNVEISNFRIQGMRYHGVLIGREDAELGGSDNSVINCNITNCGTSGIAVRNRADNTLLEANQIGDIGSGDTRGEGIYLGYGPDWTDDNVMTNHVTNTTIRGGHIYGTNAEAIDIKRNCTDVLIEYVTIRDISVKAQGAITACLSSGLGVTYPGGSLGNITIKNNYINGVTTREFEGHGIVAAFGPITIRDNVITNCADFGISVYSDFDGTDKNCVIDGNILNNNTGGDVEENQTSGNGSAYNPATITRTLNYVEGTPVNTESNDLDFKGPLPAIGNSEDITVFLPGTIPQLVSDPSIVSPAVRTTFTSGSQTFTWSDNGTTGIEKWVVKLGDAELGNEHFSVLISDPNTTSYAATGMPEDGRQLHFSLHWYIAGVWYSFNYQYTANTAAGISSLPTAVRTTNSLRINWTLTEVATGQVRYGTYAGNLDQLTTKETSYNFESHSQLISGLTSNTEYFFQVFGEFQDLTPYESQIYSATTLISAPTGDNAASTDNDAHWIGLGYTREWGDTPKAADIGMPITQYFNTDHWKNTANGGPGSNLLYNIERASTPNLIAACPLDGSPSIRSYIPFGESDGILTQGVQLGDAGMVADSVVYSMQLYSPPEDQSGVIHPNPDGNGGMYPLIPVCAWSPPGVRRSPGGGTYFTDAVSFRSPWSASNAFYIYAYIEHRRLFWEQHFIDNPDSTLRINGASYVTQQRFNAIRDNWVLIEMVVNREEPFGASNGSLELRINGNSVGSWSGINMFGVDNMRPKGFGLFHQHYRSNTTPGETFYAKDMKIYVKAP